MSKKSKPGDGKNGRGVKGGRAADIEFDHNESIRGLFADLDRTMTEFSAK